MSKEPEEKRGLVQRVLDFIFGRPPEDPPDSSVPRQSPDQQPPDTTEQPNKRYSVRDGQGEQVAESDTLEEAHELWTKLTDQQGIIIDTTTGEDVTPEPDDNGRYVVLSKDGEQLSSTGNREKALESWREETDEAGQVIDTRTGEDITAKLKGFLTKAQLEKAIDQLGAGRGIPHERLLGIDPEEVATYMRQFNSLDLPVFNIANVTGEASKQPTKTVEIKRREVEIVKNKRIIEIDVPGPPSRTTRSAVLHIADDQDVRRIRRSGEITQVSAKSLALPRSIIANRLARRQFRLPEYYEETPGKPTVRKRKVWEEFEEPKVNEWTEKVEVADDSKAQLLEVVVDVSGSMAGSSINMAMALVALLIGKHLDDGSRYIYRQFADMVGKAHRADTPNAKRKLISFLINQREDDVGAGTDILEAITRAAQDVESISQDEDIPEVLIITDGDDPSLTGYDILRVMNKDTILHAVVVGGMPSYSLREHSSTYYDLGGGRYSFQDDDWD